MGLRGVFLALSGCLCVAALMFLSSCELSAAPPAVVRVESGAGRGAARATCRVEAPANSSWIPGDSWACEVLEDGALFFSFSVSQCPEDLSSWRFSLAAEDASRGLRVMGRVGNVEAFGGGCAIYRAGVRVRRAGAYTLDLVHWWKLRGHSLPSEQLTALRRLKGNEDTRNWTEGLAPSTLEYLECFRTHLLPSDYTVVVSVAQQETEPAARLPFCDTVNSSHWGFLEWHQRIPLSGAACPFRFQNCQVRVFDSPQISRLLPNTRVGSLGDSNWQHMVQKGWAKVLDRNSTFSTVYFLYRGVIKNGRDFDGITKPMLRNEPGTCRNVFDLGPGGSNITTMQAVTTWNLAYNTRERQRRMIYRLKWLVEECRQLFPSEMARTTRFLAEATAATTSAGLSASGWRHVRNGEVDELNQLARRVLVPRFFDGVLPLFDLTYVVMTTRGNDKTNNVHMSAHMYKHMAQLELNAILATLRLQRRIAAAD